MGERVFTQANLEREGWKRILGLLEQENIVQKTRLAEMLKVHEKSDNENLLEIAERYQSQFLQQDDTFRIMWNDLASLERSVDRESSKREADLVKINDCQEKLRQEIKILQIHFNQLKEGFTNFFQAFAEPQHEHQ